MDPAVELHREGRNILARGAALTGVGLEALKNALTEASIAVVVDKQPAKVIAGAAVNVDLRSAR